MIGQIILWVVIIHVLELAAVLFYFLFAKNSKLEKLVNNQQQYISAINILVTQMDNSFKELDTKVWVSEDEELKSVFQNMKEIQNTLREINDSTK